MYRFLLFLHIRCLPGINPSIQPIEPDLYYMRVNNPVVKMLSALIKRQHPGRENLYPVHTGTYM